MQREGQVWRDTGWRRMPSRVAGLAMSLAVSLALIGCATVPQPTASTSASSLAAATPRPTASPSSAGTSTPEPSPGQGPPDATTVDATVRQNALPPALSSVAFVNVATGWAGGSGVILGTTTAGSSWRTEWTGSRSIQSLSAVDQGHVWGLGYGELSSSADELVRTIDGGRHWKTTKLVGGFREIAFTTDQVGWAVVGGITDTTVGPGRLEETVDGGQHWRASDLTAGLESVCFASPSLGWAASGSAVYRTTDVGRRWTRVVIGPNNPTNSGWLATVHCQGNTAWVLWTGGAGGGSEVYRVVRTLDRGVHWQTVLGQWDDALPNLTPIDSYAEAFGTASAGHAGFVGECTRCGYGEWSYTRTTDGGRTFSRVALAGLSGASVGDIAFADPTHGWIAGAAAGGFLLATDDGGRTWHRAYPFTAPWPALDIAFVTANLGFGLGVVGDRRAVLRTDTGGQTWQLVGQLPTDPWLLDRDPIISFADATHGWVATGTGLLATTDGGRAWQTVPGAPRGGVAFADLLHGCAGSFDTPAAQTSDGGRSWTLVDANRGVVVCAASLVTPAWAAAAQAFDPGKLLAMGAIVGGTSAWAVGLLDAERFGVESTTDGGANWTAYRWPSLTDPPYGLGSDSLLGASFVSSTEGWAFTLYGRLFETRDGGATWLEVRPR